MTANKKYKALFFVLIMFVIISGCSELNDAPPEVAAENLTYTNDMKEIFDNNCIQCHIGDTPPAGYNMTSYEGVISKATAGDPNSILVIVSDDGGSMHIYYDSEQEIEKVIQWVVEDSLAQ